MGIKVSAALAALIGMMSIDRAMAETCTCSTAYQGDPIGSIGQVDGEVLASQTAGYGPAKAGEGLGIGSHVNVANKASASVLVGTCKLNLPGNSSLDISLVDNKICLKVQGLEQAAGSTPPRSYLPAVLLGGGLLAGVVVLATQDDDNGVSK
jgi:hypothetical protein